jgi:hypothetical protein
LFFPPPSTDYVKLFGEPPKDDVMDDCNYRLSLSVYAGYTEGVSLTLYKIMLKQGEWLIIRKVASNEKNVHVYKTETELK